MNRPRMSLVLKGKEKAEWERKTGLSPLRSADLTFFPDGRNTTLGSRFKGREWALFGPERPKFIMSKINPMKEKTRSK